jgi:hypothetical protein
MPTPLEKAASKVMGTAKQAKGTLEGLTGVFKTLMEEHGEVSALLLRLKASDDPATRARLWGTVREELLAHEKGELAVVYPVFAQYPNLAAMASRHDKQAATMTALIDALDKTATSEQTWGELFDELVKKVHEHVKDEEGTIFPAGQREFGGQTDALREEYLSRKLALRAH